MADPTASDRAIDMYRRPGWLTKRAHRDLMQTVAQPFLHREAKARGEGRIQSVKIRQVDALTHEAMAGQSILRRVADSFAAGDPFLADELRFFTDVARTAKGLIIADTVDTLRDT